MFNFLLAGVVLAGRGVTAPIASGIRAVSKEHANSHFSVIATRAGAAYSAV